MSKITLSRRLPFVIPARSVKSVVAHGEKFFVENATRPFDIEIEDGNRATVRAGSETPDLDRFSKLTLYNDSASELRGVIWVGSAGMRFAYPQNTPVILRPTSGTFTTTAERATFPGFADNSASYSSRGIESGARRAFLLISHRVTSTADLLLRDENDEVFHAITQNSQQLIPVDTYFQISLSSASAGIPWTVGEYFYA